MKFPSTYFTATLLLALSVCLQQAAADENKTLIDEITDKADELGDKVDELIGGASDWWDSMKESLTNVTQFVVTAGECGVDFYDQLDQNPDLKTAEEAYEGTWSYKDSDEYDGKADAQVETWTTSYGADEFSAYKSACEAVGTTAVWWDIPSGYTLSCATNDGSYTFHLVYNDYGDCYPATDSCASYADGMAAFAEEVSKEVSKDGNDYYCSESDSPPPEGDAADKKEEQFEDEEEKQDNKEAEEEGSAASMFKMTAAAVVATAVGTVVYL